MTDAIICTVESVRTRATTQEALLTLAVPLEQAALISGFMGKIGKFVGVAFAEVDQPPEPEPKKPREDIGTDDPRHPLHKAEKKAKPYGYLAAKLYANGFFLNPKVLEKIGSDEEFLAWVRQQPCCCKTPFPAGWQNGDRILHHDGDVVAAHVRRIADGAGTSVKPPYSAIPLCNAHHTLQHQEGESAIGGKEWCNDQRVMHVTKWASHKLANTLGHPSMGFVPPEALREWAMRMDLLQYLPQVYRA